MKNISKKGGKVNNSSLHQNKEKALESVKKYITEKLYNPYNVNIAVKERDNHLLIGCGYWKVSLDIRDGWVCVSTRPGCGIGEYDLNQVVDIRDNKDTIIDMYTKEVVTHCE